MRHQVVAEHWAESSKHPHCMPWRHTLVQHGHKIQILRSAQEMDRIRPLWDSLIARNGSTIFQDFGLNQLAARMFAGREEPYVICVESSGGAAIVPAVLRQKDLLHKKDVTVRLLGEELFDYRGFLHQGDKDVLWAALATLAERKCPLEIVAVRECDRHLIPAKLPLLPFAAAPMVQAGNISAETFAAAHSRLGRNLRRMARLGFQLLKYDGNNPQLLHSIYQRKAEQQNTCLFHDRARIEFMVAAAQLLPEAFEIFTLEHGSSLAAALVTLLEPGVRRFYTGWFSAELEKHSPALTLIYEVTRQSLAAGLNCDYMTGEQPYKMRLATGTVPLFRVHAAAEQLAHFGKSTIAELRVAI